MTTHSQIIRQFNRQIKKEYDKFLDEKKCPSYWSKMLYLTSKRLSIKDWKQIRNKDYYLKRNKLQGVDKSKFIYNEITNYLKTK